MYTVYIAISDTVDRLSLNRLQLNPGPADQVDLRDREFVTKWLQFKKVYLIAENSKVFNKYEDPSKTDTKNNPSDRLWRRWRRAF